VTVSRTPLDPSAGDCFTLTGGAVRGEAPNSYRPELSIADAEIPH
jgi:hypothetical protein